MAINYFRCYISLSFLYLWLIYATLFKYYINSNHQNEAFLKMSTSQIGFYYLLFSYFWSFKLLCAALGSQYVSRKSCIGFEKVQKLSHHNSILNTNDFGNVRVFSPFIFEKVCHEVNAKYIIISNIISNKKLLNVHI